MAIPQKTKKQIYELIDKIVMNYIGKASKSPKQHSGNPFVLALLEDFEPLMHRIHGLKTSMGNEMEKIAMIIAIGAWGKDNVKRKINRKVKLPKNVFQTIDTIINNLSNSKTSSNYSLEIKQVLDACKSPSKEHEEHTYEFDLELYDKKEKHLYFLEMKGPDPNTTEVPGAKKRLLTELAWGAFNKKFKNVDSIFAIYYNNKYPRPYNNPKVLYYFSPDGGLLVHNDFWNFIGRDKNTFKELVAIFKRYGKENKEKIWRAFSRLIKDRN